MTRTISKLYVAALYFASASLFALDPMFVAPHDLQYEIVGAFAALAGLLTVLGISSSAEVVTTSSPMWHA